MARVGALRLLGLSVLTGLALPLAFSTWRVPWLAWIALVPLLLAVRRASPRRAALLGLVSGILTDGLGVHWLLASGVSPAAFSLLILFAASKYAAFGVGASLAYRHRAAAAVLVLPALWVGLEWLRANLGWLSIPWGLLGYSQYEVGLLVGAGSVAGVYGVSWVLVVGNVATAELCEAWIARQQDPGHPTALPIPALAASVALVAAILTIGNLHASARHSAPGLRVAIVQAGVYDPELQDVRERDAILERYVELTRQAAEGASLDLVIWPESSVPVLLPQDVGAVDLLFRLADQIETRLLVAANSREKGTRTRGPPEVANSAFLIGPGRRIEGRYDKIRLLPFDEYRPLRDWISWPAWVTTLRRDAVAGSELRALETGGLRYGVQICFESLFASEGRRAANQGVDFLVTLTNESFAGPEAAHELLFAMNLFRAAENGLPLVRATTTSVSALVAADGTIVERGDGKPGVIVADLPAALPPTLYRTHGDGTLLVLAGLGLAALAAAPRTDRAHRPMGWPAGPEAGESGSLG